MSLQAELGLQILIALYVEADARKAQVDRVELVKHFNKQGVGDGRIDYALKLLERLKLIDVFSAENGASKVALSMHGMDWFERNLILVSRSPTYEFEGRPCRRIILSGPDGVRSKKNEADQRVDWTKWSAIFAGLSILVTILLWWLH